MSNDRTFYFLGSIVIDTSRFLWASRKLMQKKCKSKRSDFNSSNLTIPILQVLILSRCNERHIHAVVSLLKSNKSATSDFDSILQYKTIVI